MFLRPAVTACALVLGVLAAAPARAHGVPHGTGTLRLNGDRVFSVISFPVSLLPLADEDQDGRLSPAELERNRGAVTAVVRARLRVESGLEQGEVMFEDLLLPHAEGNDSEVAPSTHVDVMRSTRFSQPVTAPRLVALLFEGPENRAQLELSLLDERGALLERTTLSRAVPSHRFAAGPLAVAHLHALGTARWLAHTQPAWALLAAALLAGALLGRRPGWAVAAATACGSALLLYRALVLRASVGLEAPHDLAAGLGTTLVLTACALGALGLGLIRRAR